MKGEGVITSPPSSNQEPKIIKKEEWSSPKWFKPLEGLPGYKKSNHSKAAEVIRLACAEAGVDKAEVVQGFAEFYPTARYSYAWSDPVAALRKGKVLAIQIQQALTGQKSQRGDKSTLRIGMDGKRYRDFDNSHEKYVEAAKTDIG